MSKAKQKLQEQDRLFNSILSTQEIRCTTCGTEDSIYNTDEYDACEAFQKKGWTSKVECEVLCPSCSNEKYK